MTRKFAILAAVVLAVVVGQAAIMIHLERRSQLAAIECRARNAGVPLGAAEGSVHVYEAGRRGELRAEGRLRQALSVPAGRYDVRVLLSGSRDRQTVWLRDLELDRGRTLVREVDFAAGEVSVEVATGSGARVVAYVFPAGDPDTVITSMEAGETVLLGAGLYDLRAVLTIASEEKGVEWLRGLEVSAGQHTRRTVAFRRGRLLVTARNAGRELRTGTVALTVYRAGDVQEEVVDSGVVGVPLNLEAGSYDVKATFTDSSDRPSRWLRRLDVKERETLEQAVEFSSGTVVFQVDLLEGERLEEFSVYVYYYRAGDHRQPVAYTPAGEAAVLVSGRYDVRLNFFRAHDQPDLWVMDIPVEAGKIVERVAAFPCGRLLVRCRDGDGAELIGDNAFLHVHAVGARTRPIVTARCGEVLTLTRGVYDLRVVDTRDFSNEEWLEGVEVRAGESREVSVTFAAKKPGG